jgi:hypothetical protein
MPEHLVNNSVGSYELWNELPDFLQAELLRRQNPLFCSKLCCLVSWWQNCSMSMFKNGVWSGHKDSDVMMVSLLI